MSTYVLIPKERKALRKLKRAGSLPESDIPNAQKLLSYGVICMNVTGEMDEYLNEITDGTVSVTDEYERYAEAHRWFTLEYAVSHLLIPLLCASIGGVITSMLCG